MFKRFGLFVFLTVLAANANLGIAQTQCDCANGYCVGTAAQGCCADSSSLNGTCASSSSNNCAPVGGNFPVQDIIPFSGPGGEALNHVDSLNDNCVCSTAVSGCTPAPGTICWGTVACRPGFPNCVCQVSVKRAFDPSFFMFLFCIWLVCLAYL